MPTADFGKLEKVLRLGEGRRMKRLAAQADYIASLERLEDLDVKTVLVGGNVLMRDRELVAFDEGAAAQALVDSIRRPQDESIRAWQHALAEVKPYCDAFYDEWSSPQYDPYYTVNSR